MALADEIQKMILSALESMEVTSANPTHINTLIQVNNIDLPDLEQFLKKDDDDKAIQKPLSEKDTDERTLTDAIGKQTKSLDMKVKKLDGSKQFLDKAGISGKNIPGILGATGGKGLLGGTAGISRLAAFAGPVAAPVAIALMVEPVTKAIIKELQRPGGFLDKRVKIEARKEAFAGLDRQTRQNTKIGDRQVIIQQFEGFRNYEGFASTNTSRLVREGGTRTADIGLFDRAEGVE